MAFFGPKLEGAVASSKNRRRIILEFYISSFISFESNMKASESHETRFWQASSGREAQPRRRNQQTTAMQRRLVEVEKRRCTRHPALTRRLGTAQIQKIKSCNAGHSARVMFFHQY
jgi:hypothetical protein